MYQDRIEKKKKLIRELTCLHKLHYKINKFVLLHLLTVIVCDKKANVITLQGEPPDKQMKLGKNLHPGNCSMQKKKKKKKKEMRKDAMLIKERIQDNSLHRILILMYKMINDNIKQINKKIYD